MAQRPLSEVIRDEARVFLTLPGVAGVGQGEQGGRPCIVVYVEQRTGELERSLPSTLEGYSLLLEVTGEVRALT
jgi:hypothetical protein